jgi:hypothetical protein
MAKHHPEQPSCPLAPSVSAGTVVILLSLFVGAGLAIPTASAVDVKIPTSLRGGMGARAGVMRDKFIRDEGWTDRSEAAVALGLEWLAKRQQADGHWAMDERKADGDIAATAYGLLPFLGAGYTPKGKQRLHAQTVDRGLKYLILKQNKDGYFGGGMLAHALATLVVCEMYALTADPAVRGPAQRAANTIVKMQHKGGGWNNTPGESGETLVTTWTILALKAGHLGGLTVPRETLKGASNYLDSVADADDSSYGATNPKDGTPATAAAGLLAREILERTPGHPGLKTGIDQLLKRPPSAELRDLTYIHFASQVIFHTGGKNWAEWNPRMRELLIAQQDQANHKGSWSPDLDARGGKAGRLAATSLALLTLEVYYRYLPLCPPE